MSIVLLAYMGLMVFVYHDQERRYRSLVENHFREICKAKQTYFEFWRVERQGDGELLQRQMKPNDSARPYLKNAYGESWRHLESQLAYLVENDDYCNASLLAATGEYRTVVLGTGAPPLASGQEDLRRRIREGKVQVYMDRTPEGETVCATLVPLLGTDVPEGAVLLTWASDAIKFEQLLEWPMPSSTGRMNIMPAGELPSYLRASVEEEERTDDLLVGIRLAYANDEKGAEIVATAVRLRETDWWLVATQNVDEAFAVWRQRFWSLLVAFGSLGLSLLLTAAFFHQRELKHHYLNLHKAQKARRHDELRHAAILSSLGEGVIITDRKGLVQSLNPMAEAMTGWTTAEAWGRTLESVYHLVDSVTRQALPSPLTAPAQAEKDQKRWGRNMLLCHGGGSHVITHSLATLKDAQNGSAGFILVFRDITENAIREDRLAESEERFRSLFDQSLEGIVLLDIDGMVVVGNYAACNALDFKPGEFEGINFQHLLEAQDVNETVELDELDRPRRCEAQLTRRDGSAFPVEVQISSASFGGKSYRLVVFRDISQRITDQLALAESKRHMATLLDNLQGMAYRCSMDREWTISFVSSGVEKLTGYRATQLLGNSGISFGSLIHPEDRERVWEEVQKAVVENRIFQLEYRIITAGGAIKWVWEQGKAVQREGTLALEGFISDITERHLDRSELELLRAAIEYAGDTVMITDEHAEILYVNPAFERVTGYVEAEVLGKNPAILKSGRMDDAFYGEMWRIISSGRVWQGQMVNRKKNGELFTEEATISPVLGTDGGIKNYIAVKRDITGEQQIREQLQQAQRMEALGQLAGGIAHDFNNILQVIQGCAGLLLEQMQDITEERGHVQEIDRASHRAAELTRQLLTLGRRQILAKSHIELNGLMGGLFKMIRRVLRENIELQFQVGAGELWILADPGQIEQVVMNLCVNARDAMPEGGQLVLQTFLKKSDGGGREAGSPARPGGYAGLRVSDTGKGMDEKILVQIFDPFFTTKEVGQGTGLGLAMVYSIIKQHGGIIEVESKPGRGSIFEILLPLAPKPVKESQPQTRPKTSVLHGQERILLVEDDSMVRKLTRNILLRAGYDVESAVHGEEAIAHLKQPDFKVDLLLTDVVMPRAGGKAVWEVLKRINPRAKVLFMTGYATGVFDEVELRKLQSSFIGKPFTPDQLLEKVRELLGPNRGDDPADGAR